MTDNYGTAYDIDNSDHNMLVQANLPEVLYLVKARGQWIVYAEVSEQKAIARAKALEIDEKQSVRIFRVDEASLSYLEVQREIVRESLVPKSTSVHS